jgi:hypothetical protein
MKIMHAYAYARMTSHISAVYGMKQQVVQSRKQQEPTEINLALEPCIHKNQAANRSKNQLEMAIVLNQFIQ